MRKTAAIATLGCKTNQFESSVMEETLVSCGYEVVPFAAGADLVIVNTCTVTAATDAQSRNLIRRCYRLNPQVRIVVTGCYAQMRPELFAEFPGVALVLGNEEKNDLSKFLQEKSPEPMVRVSDIRNHCRPMTIPSTSRSSRSRAFLQVQNGCDAFCSYCIIPHVRGPSRSLPVSAVVKKAATLSLEGFDEIVLTGIHLGHYGRDLSPSATFTDLVAELDHNSSIKRLRIGSIEPKEIPDRLIDMMAASAKICPHLHIPLQSGDDRILALMRRPYSRDFFHDLVMKITSKVADVAIGIDVITGFPGETEQEFRNTFELIAALPLSYLHVFPFSARPGTEAAGFPGQVSSTVVKERAAILRNLGEAKEKTFMERFLGATLEVIVEGREKGRMHCGLSRNYLKVVFPCPRQEEKQTVWVRIEKLGTGELEGRLVGSGEIMDRP